MKTLETMQKKADVTPIIRPILPADSPKSNVRSSPKPRQIIVIGSIFFTTQSPPGFIPAINCAQIAPKIKASVPDPRLNKSLDCSQSSSKYAIAPKMTHRATPRFKSPLSREIFPAPPYSCLSQVISMPRIDAPASHAPTIEPTLPSAVTSSTLPTLFFQNSEVSSSFRKSWASFPVGEATFSWV